MLASSSGGLVGSSGAPAKTNADTGLPADYVQALEADAASAQAGSRSAIAA